MMKTSTKMASMPGLRPFVIAALVLVTGYLATCDVMKVPDPFVPDNEFDPSGDSYVAPTVQITEGPADNSTVNTNVVTISWDGNKPNMLFQFTVSGGEWGDYTSPWSNLRSLTVDYLDELTYSFEVRSGYLTEGGDPEEISPGESITFTVDAVQGPALRMSPTRFKYNLNSTFDLNIIAEDVTDLTMTKIKINFNPGMLQYVSKSNGSFLTKNGGSVLEFTPVIDNSSGMIEINSGVAGAIPAGVTGTGTILVITFQAVGTGETEVNFVSNATLLRNHNNVGIAITTQDLYGARVIIQ